MGKHQPHTFTCQCLTLNKLLDYTFMYQFNQRPQMELADAQAPLPCSQELWESRSWNISTQFKAGTYHFRFV